MQLASLQIILNLCLSEWVVLYDSWASASTVLIVSLAVAMVGKLSPTRIEESAIAGTGKVGENKLNESVCGLKYTGLH